MEDLATWHIPYISGKQLNKKVFRVMKNVEQLNLAPGAQQFPLRQHTAAPPLNLSLSLGEKT